MRNGLPSPGNTGFNADPGIGRILQGECSKIILDPSSTDRESYNKPKEFVG